MTDDSRPALFLTATARLARHLRFQARSGRLQAPRGTLILPLDEWLQRQWQTLNDGESLLNRSQALYLWEQIIAADDAVEALLDVPSLAALADDAFRLQCLYGTPPAAALDSVEAQRFQIWAVRFADALARAPRPWIHPAQLAARLREALADGRLAIRGKLFLAGLDELPPALRLLLQAAAEKGAEVLPWRDPAPQGKCVFYALSDQEQELRWVAAAIRKTLAAGERVGVVVPDMSAYRPLIERIFTEYFQPQALCLDREERDPPPFDFSQGRRLDQDPLIRQALTLLRLPPRPMTADAAAALLLAPFPCPDPERPGRAEVESGLRRHAPALDLFALSRLCGEKAPRFAQALQALRQCLRDAPARASCADWSRHFAACLDSMAWPGDCPPDSTEAAARQAWEQALESLARLDQVATPLPRRQALAHLERICAGMVLPSPGGTYPIEVMGALEAVGLHFDRVFILGLTERALPVPLRPHPLLPLRWQRQHRLPFANPDQQLHFAAALWARLLQTGGEIVCSFPRFDGELPLNPSPLIPPAQVRVVEERQRPFWHFWESAGQFVPEENPPVPPPATLPRSPGFLKSQAICSFQAFAHYRLDAVPLSPFEERPTPRDIGNLIHRVLQDLWHKLGTQAALRALMDSGRLRNELDALLMKHLRGMELALGSEHEAALQSSLLGLFMRWMEKETARPDFSVVAVEEALELTVGNLTIHLRVDRLDRQSDDGALIVVDYKTGYDVKLESWLSLADPQIPLYILATGADAAVYAWLNREKSLGWKGYGRQPGWPGIEPLPDWDAQCDAWHRELDTLATDFLAGRIRIAPREGLKSCGVCGTQVLCRVHERGTSLITRVEGGLEAGDDG